MKWNGKRAGSGNPFFGRTHTDEFKAALAARSRTWTDAEVAMIRAWYTDHAGTHLRLDDLAALMGKTKSGICRVAGQIGLTRTSRPVGRKVTAKHTSPEAARQAIGEASRKRIADNGHPRGMLGKKHSTEHCERQSSARRGKKLNLTESQRQANSDRTSRMHAAGVISNSYSRCKAGRRDDLGGRFFRSSWEANYARYLNWLQGMGHIATWDYETTTFWFEAIRRGVRSYKPDFQVTDNAGDVHYVEVKGWMDPKSKTKIARMARYHPSVDLRVVGEKAYREIERTIGVGLPGWERQKARA